MATNERTQTLEAEESFNSRHSENLSTDGGHSSDAGARRKTKGTVVKSRYMQTKAKTSSSTDTKQPSTFAQPRPFSSRGTQNPKEKIKRRQTMNLSTATDSALVSSVLKPENVLQSTVLDGHSSLPEFDLSVIRDPVTAAKSKSEERDLATETLLLAFLTTKIEHNTHKLRDEAENNILMLMEKERQLREEVDGLKQRHLLLEEQKRLNHLLDLQLEVLSPVAAASGCFTEDYTSFAAAVDVSRHALPVRNLDTGDQPEALLEEAVERLNLSGAVLHQLTRDTPTNSPALTESLRSNGAAASDVCQQLSSALSALQEYSSLLSREAVNISTIGSVDI